MGFITRMDGTGRRRDRLGAVGTGVLRLCRLVPHPRGWGPRPLWGRAAADTSEGGASCGKGPVNPTQAGKGEQDKGRTDKRIKRHVKISRPPQYVSRGTPSHWRRPAAWTPHETPGQRRTETRLNQGTVTGFGQGWKRHASGPQRGCLRACPQRRISRLKR